MKLQSMIPAALKASLLALPLALAPAVFSVVVQEVSADFAAGLGAVEAAEPKCKPRKLKGVSSSFLKKITEVQETLAPEEGSGKKPDVNGAIALLNDMERKKDKLNKAELAQLYQFYGYAYYQKDDTKKATKYYELVLAQSPQIPCGTEVQMLMTVGQMHFMLEDYKTAIKFMKRWENMTTIVGSDQLAVMSQVYYQLGDSKNSLVYINRAVKKFEDKGKTPKENWFALQRALYYEKEDFKTVTKVLTKLVRYYPKTDYYKQLAGMYGLQGQQKNQMHMLDAVYVMGGLKKEKELVNLAYLYMDVDTPYRAAKILEKGLKQKVIEPTSKNLELLGNAWIMASETKKSIPVMERAAAKSDKGELYSTLSRTYLNNDQFQKAITAGNKAIKRGGLKRADQLNLALGMAHLELKQYEKAIKQFKSAAKDKRSEKFAKNWIKYAENEKRREKSLKGS